VLVQGAGMPQGEQLPLEISPLTRIQALSVPSSVGFGSAAFDLASHIHQVAGCSFEDFRTALADCQRTGLVLAKSDFRQDVTVLEEMRSSQQLLVVMNDGRGWLDQNSELILERLRDADKRTRIALLHPKSGFMETLIRKNGKTLANQVEDIRRTYRMLRANVGAVQALEIKGHFMFNPFSIILGDRYAFVSPYFYNESGALPLLKLASSAASGLYHRFRDDALRLIETALPIAEDDFQDRMAAP
jgi:hypothetical protein